MYLNPRHTQIIQTAKVAGRVGVDELAEKFAVTPQTIRKDLNELCKARLLSRIHGGPFSPLAQRIWSMSSGALFLNMKNSP